MWTITLSGSKEDVKSQIESQASNPSDKVYLKALVDAAPGTHVSMSGSMTGSPDGTHGTISLTGSFFTV